MSFLDDKKKLGFFELVNSVNALEPKKSEELKNIVSNIDISANNFNDWVNNIFSDNVTKFDMSKLPYLIDELYKSDSKLNFMLCCMLLESTCDKLEFITSLESYPLFVEKFKTMLNTIVTVYDSVDNDVANCMCLIVLENDPKFEYFDDELKIKLIDATKKKLSNILNYLKNENVNPLVFNDLEIIVDMASYLNNKEISSLVDQIDKIGNNGKADLFIIKYKVINNMDISKEKLDSIRKDDLKLIALYNILEKLGVNQKYLSDVTQEELAKSNLIKWLEYPTELGSVPDKIELLGEFTYKNEKFYAYKFSKIGFSINGDLIGVSGGFPLDKVSSNTARYTFSKFEVLSDDWEKQAKDVVDLIASYLENSTKNN